MPRSVSYEHDFAHSADTVFQQGKQKTYIEAKAPALDHYKAELVSLEAGSIYWHFVDVVWICLFTTFYLVGLS